MGRHFLKNILIVLTIASASSGWFSYSSNDEWNVLTTYSLLTFVTSAIALVSFVYRERKRDDSVEKKQYKPDYPTEQLLLGMVATGGIIVEVVVAVPLVLALIVPAFKIWFYLLLSALLVSSSAVATTSILKDET